MTLLGDPQQSPQAPAGAGLSALTGPRPLLALVWHWRRGPRGTQSVLLRGGGREHRAPPGAPVASPATRALPSGPHPDRLRQRLRLRLQVHGPVEKWCG